MFFLHGRTDLCGGLRHRRAGDCPLCQKQKNRPGGGLHRRGGSVCDPSALRPYRRRQRAGGEAGGKAWGHGGGHHRHRCPRQILRGRMGCPTRLRHFRHGACQGGVGGDLRGGYPPLQPVSSARPPAGGYVCRGERPAGRFHWLANKGTLRPHPAAYPSCAAGRHRLPAGHLRRGGGARSADSVRGKRAGHGGHLRRLFHRPEAGRGRPAGRL